MSHELCLGNRKKVVVFFQQIYLLLLRPFLQIHFDEITTCSSIRLLSLWNYSCQNVELFYSELLVTL